jgi:hypothetical protein
VTGSGNRHIIVLTVKRAALALLLVAAAAVLYAQSFDPRRDSLAREAPQPIYSNDPADPWNQVFFDLFTRTVEARLLPAGMTPLHFMAPESQHLLRTGAAVTRIESGDRAIDPLYSSWVWMGSGWLDMSTSGQWGVLKDPRYTRLLAALGDVEASAARSDPLRRALMQSDLWAAYDLLSATVVSRPGRRPQDDDRLQRTTALTRRLASAMRALALSKSQIDALPDTLRDAGKAGVVPDFADLRSGWMEIRWFPTRDHERAVQDRRVARVFLKPKQGQDVPALLAKLRQGEGSDAGGIEAAALVVQILLIADDGTVMPSRIAYDVQVRRPTLDGSPPVGNTFLQFELSRRKLLQSPRSAGLVRFDESDPAYLPIAGNDLSFATRPRADAEATVVPLRERCSVCHGPNGRHLMTFARAFADTPPPVERLDPSADRHPRDVADRKMARDDFKSLVALWRQPIF